jgi:hypothetical protein
VFRSELGDQAFDLPGKPVRKWERDPDTIETRKPMIEADRQSVGRRRTRARLSAAEDAASYPVDP